jgi:hypothetical protein
MPATFKGVVESYCMFEGCGYIRDFSFHLAFKGRASRTSATDMSATDIGYPNHACTEKMVYKAR